MDTRSQVFLCRALNISRPRVDQWLSRGLIPGPETTQGKSRRWEFDDAMRLAILADVADAGLPLEPIAQHLLLRGIHGKTAYLALYYGAFRLVPTSPRNAPAHNKADLMKAGRPIYQPGVFQGEIVDDEGLIALLDNPENRLAIVINLDAVEARLKAIWAEAE